jgi:hypothetical protein
MTGEREKEREEREETEEESMSSFFDLHKGRHAFFPLPLSTKKKKKKTSSDPARRRGDNSAGPPAEAPGPAEGRRQPGRGLEDGRGQAAPLCPGPVEAVSEGKEKKRKENTFFSLFCSLSLTRLPLFLSLHFKNFTTGK